ncbi:MAG: hypothetical protein JWO62_89 [Acidimicrobiaceae bacterium]|nr:hypothetical protein [Acidimicrobiaceae bacterium]
MATTFSMPPSRSASRLSVTFDDDHSVADAGLALVTVLSEKLGLEELAQELALHTALLVDAICHRYYGPSRDRDIA